MAEYMFLVQSDDTKKVSDAEMQQRLDDYRIWMTRMMAEGRVRAGQPLAPTGAMVRRDRTVLTDGPFLEPKEIIAGYVIVTADDLDDAIALAQQCPLLHHCELIVRPLVEIPEG